MKNNKNLVNTTKQVFDECSQIYLKEDKHWGCDLDIILEHLEKFEEPEIIDLGTGNAWHLANLFFLTSITPKRVIGIDYSDSMLETAKKLLNSVLVNDRPIIEKVELQKEDILSLPFKDESFDIALCLNNTLGNIPDETLDKTGDRRKRALIEIRRILKKSGVLILSVYNADRLTEEDSYGEVFELDHKLSNLEKVDLVVRYKETGTPYYSHWFNENEISKLIYEVSFRVVYAEKRKKRIIIVAMKKKKSNSIHENHSHHH